MISSLELARLCGVSQGTVDRALHGRPGVSPATRARIEAAAREHGYRPHPAARELLSGKSQILGALMPASSAVFFLDLIHALKNAGDSHGLRLCITPIADEAEFTAALEDFAARRVRGVVAVPPEENLQISGQLASAVKIATFLSPVANTDVPLFAPDEVATGARAVEYLSDLGHARILHVSFPRRTFAVEQRRAGYEAGMTSRRLKPGTCAFTGPESLMDAVAQYDPTALFCHNDWLALAAIRALESSGRRVPADISVLGVDDSPSFNQFRADISTLAYPAVETASKAVHWLATGEDRRPISPLQVVEKSTTLAVR